MKRLAKIFVMVFILNVLNITVFSAETEFTEDFTNPAMPGWLFSGGMAYAAGTPNSITNNWSNLNGQGIYDEISWSGRYVYSVEVRNDGSADSNKIRVIFNYANNNNYYYLEMGGGNADLPDTAHTVKLRKVVNGGHSDIQTYGSYLTRNNYVKVEITYDNGFISVKATRGTGVETQIFSDVQDSAHTSGKIGVGTQASVGRFSNITVIGTGGYTTLRVASSNIDEGAENVDVDTDVSIEFNLALSAETVTGTNVLVKCADLYMEQSKYSISLMDGNRIVVSFNSPLDFKTVYTIEVTEGVISTEWKTGLSDRYSLSFKTVPPPFDLDSYSLTILGQEIETLYNQRGKTVDMELVVSNGSISEGQTYAVTAAVVTGGGAMLAGNFFTGSLGVGESDSLSGTIEIPADIDQNTRLCIFVWDSFSGMKRLCPAYVLY